MGNMKAKANQIEKDLDFKYAIFCNTFADMKTEDCVTSVNHAETTTIEIQVTQLSNALT